MGSCRDPRGACLRIGAFALMLAVAAGCGGSGATQGNSGSPLASGSAIASGSGASTSGGPLVTTSPLDVDRITATASCQSQMYTPLAHLYGVILADFVTITVKNGNPAPARIVATSEVDGYTNRVSDTVWVPADSTTQIHLNPRLTPAAIDSLTAQTTADLHVTVSLIDEGQPTTVLDQTRATVVTSRRDFPWSFGDFTQQESLDLVAVMVTPFDPAVEALIRKAADYDPRGVMTSGYDSAGDENGQVLQRLEDIWQAESAYDLTYISTAVSFSSEDSQRVRLPSEVLADRSGNCIELALLYASAVEALGMQPILVFIPGHVFLGVRKDGRDATDETDYFVETTMIGRARFDGAVAAGASEWQQYRGSVRAGVKDYGLVNVEGQRKAGIVPIPWH